jgi:hypothetical protein
MAILAIWWLAPPTARGHFPDLLVGFQWLSVQNGWHAGCYTACGFHSGGFVGPSLTVALGAARKLEEFFFEKKNQKTFIN